MHRIINKKSSVLFIKSFIICLFISVSCISCADTVSAVSLVLPAYAPDYQSRRVPLIAMDKNARRGAIAAPKKSASMCFAFEKSPELLSLTESELYALELEMEPIGSEVGGSTAKTVKTASPEPVRLSDTGKAAPENTGSLPAEAASSSFTVFAAGLLYADDFSAGKLKKGARPRCPVTAQITENGTFTLSIGFAGIDKRSKAVYGFMISSQTALRLKRAAIVPVRYGWIKDKTVCWYGVPAGGGVIPTELFTETALPLRTELPKLSTLMHSGSAGRDTVVIHFDKAMPIRLSEGEQPALSFHCNNRRISVRRAPQLYRLTLDGCLFPEDFFTVEQLGGGSGLSGITVEYDTVHPLAPITADPGLVLRWPQEQWRQPSYELFSWEQFPSVLIFDFADYAVQDASLKRLAFFAEKKGFAGTLISDETMRSLHGFNAHDYGAETLAQFFRKAERESFPLNEAELQLKTILLHNGIIVRTDNGFKAGRGAIVSLSRQSSEYLRYRFITHECLHGIYFTEQDFRDTVAAVFRQTDPRAIRFLRRYFEVYPSLMYNTDDIDLFQNEFMAYILQQDREDIRQYYVERLSKYRALNEAEPALCRYMQETNAEAFMQAEAQMSSFLYMRWGIKGGRIRLTKIDSL